MVSSSFFTSRYLFPRRWQLVYDTGNGNGVINIHAMLPYQPKKSYDFVELFHDRVAGGSCGQARREELEIQPMVKLCRRNKKETKRKSKVSPLLWPEKTRGSRISLLLLPSEPGSPELVKSSIVVEVGKPELLLLSSPTPAVVGGFASQLLPSTRKREEGRGSHHRRSPPSSPTTVDQGRGEEEPMVAGHAQSEREERRRPAATVLGTYDVPELRGGNTSKSKEFFFHDKEVAAYCSSLGIDQEKDILSKMIEESGDDESDMRAQLDSRPRPIQFYCRLHSSISILQSPNRLNIELSSPLDHCIVIVDTVAQSQAPSSPSLLPNRRLRNCSPAQPSSTSSPP
nr:hypothetical protein Iba_chr03aCG6330 [Ipomoea batatas]